MKMYDIISKKKYGGELTNKEIQFFIDGYMSGEIPDYQASALLMAICLKGMSERETADLTTAMANSGDTVDLSGFKNLSADKHSTGGVGDKTSLIIGPIVASLGGKVTKMSGRGLGHTGGTVDKLEAIPGYKTTLTGEEFLKQIEKVGMAIIGQSGNLTPADKKLYALRDVTATVDSIPLITSSIMSKKLAAGSKNIVLDVKVGSGAFMKTPKQAEELAYSMVKIGKACGRNMAAVITNMDRPLGSAVGNALEVIEAVKILKNEIKNDLREVSLSLAKTMIMLIFGFDEEKATSEVNKALTSGAAYQKMKEWIRAQGGDISYIEETEKFPKASVLLEVKSNADGYIASMNTEKIGLVSTLLGAGRTKKEDIIDYSAGIEILKKTGEVVKKGEVVAILHTNIEEVVETASREYLSAIRLDKNCPNLLPDIYKTII